MRITTPLPQQLEILNKRLALDALEVTHMDKHAGGYCLMTSDESRYISPRLSRQEMQVWMDGFLEGLDYRRHARKCGPQGGA